MSMSTTNPKPWTPWHLRFHKKLLLNPNLLPSGASLLLAVSGGQDSMVLLKLMLDLQRLYKWKLNIWHGDHAWHNESGKFAQELKNWCEGKALKFFLDTATKEQTKSELNARDWRYAKLAETAKIVSSRDIDHPCQRVITGHTATDRAETLLLNLARGSNLAGISSLSELRPLNKNIQLVRPLLGFNRYETAHICKEMQIPIWIDPSNKNTNLSRNKVRQEIIPVLEELHPGCSMRIAALAERLSNYNKDQHALSNVLIKILDHPQGLCRKTLSKLPITARSTVLFEWLKDKGAPCLSARQLEELSHKISTKNPPGCLDLHQNWKIKWKKDFIQLENPNQS